MPNKKYSDLVLKEFGKQVRELRAQAGYSQESFATKVGLHRTYMSAIERGEHNVSLLNIKKIAKALKVAVGELMKGVK